MSTGIRHVLLLSVAAFFCAGTSSATVTKVAPSLPTPTPAGGRAPIYKPTNPSAQHPINPAVLDACDQAVMEATGAILTTPGGGGGIPAAIGGKAQRLPGTCTLHGAYGDIDLVFDNHGLPVSATGFDSAGRGHRYEVSLSTSPGYYINNKNWQGPRLDHMISYYEAAPNSNGTFQLVGSTRIHHDVASRWIRYEETVVDGNITTLDSCDMWYKSAESTALGSIVVGTSVIPYNSALVAHHDGVGTRHEQGRWNGTSAPPIKCGSYLPHRVNFTFFQDVQRRFTSIDVTRANFAAKYASFGADFHANPLGLFSVAHRNRLQGESILHTQADPKATQHLADEYTDAMGNASVAALSVLAAGAASGPIDPLLGAATFLIVFDGTILTDWVKDWYNNEGLFGPDSMNDPMNEGIDESDRVTMTLWDSDANSPTNPDGSQDPSGGANDGVGAPDEGGGCTDCPPADANAITRLPSKPPTTRIIGK